MRATAAMGVSYRATFDVLVDKQDLTACISVHTRRHRPPLVYCNAGKRAQTQTRTTLLDTEVHSPSMTQSDSCLF